MKKISLIISALLAVFLLTAYTFQNYTALEQEFLNEMDIPAAQSNTALNNGHLIERVITFSAAPANKLPGSKSNSKTLVIEDRYWQPTTNAKNASSTIIFRKEIWEIDFGQSVPISNVAGNKLRFTAQTVPSRYKTWTAQGNVTSAPTYNKVMDVPDISQDLRYANKAMVLGLKALAIFQELKRKGLGK